MSITQVVKDKQVVNEVILRSIPIDRRLKKFFIQKFKRMVECNGQSYACDRMKQLREALCGYRADPQRIAHIDAWLLKSGFARSGWLRELYSYMDTCPSYALQFVKLYCGPNDPVVTVGQAAESQHRVLEKARDVNPKTPGFMAKWLHHIGRERKLSPKLYQSLKHYWSTGDWNGPRILESYPITGLASYVLKNGMLDWMKNYVLNHSYDEYLTYVNKWKSLLYIKPIPDDRISAQMGSVVPRAEMYVDYGKRSDYTSKYSESFEQDLNNFLAMENYLGEEYEFGGNGLTTADFDYILSLLPESFELMYLDPDFVLPGVQRSMLDGTYVGQIHHIPKKGTVKRRSIAAPNRFIQFGMAPADFQLSVLLKKLGRVRDCTYNQNAQDLYIANRVNNDNLYAGSVDLSQATDHLPFEWMISIWENLFEGRVSQMVERSWTLFVHASKGVWLNEGYRDRWYVGQPLGALPSFRCLGLTHNLLLASLAFTLGYGHDPYVVLGDDVVIMNKKLRKAYIQLMTSAGIPLSLHKSYEGRGVEFAGKWFFKNQAPFYNTDQHAITWNSLFDYQFATGVYIPYGNLPTKIRRKFAHKVVEQHLPERYSELAYRLIVQSMMPPRGSNVSMDRITLDPQWIADFIISIEPEDHDTPPGRSSGITFLRGAHPVTFGRLEFANKDGWFQSYRKIDDWYRDKYRRVSSDKLVSASAKVIVEALTDCSEN